MTERSRLPCLGILQTLLLADCNGGGMEKKIARDGASESERESLPDTELRPSSAECSCLRDFAKSMQTANSPYSRVRGPPWR